jgi:hypothetical protein
MQRVWLTLAGLAIVAGSRADDLSSAQAMMASALVDLHNQRNAVLFLDGQVEMGRSLETFGLNVYWQNANPETRLPAMLDANYYQNSKLLQRFVGDGEYFWTYDASKFQYSSNSYSSQVNLTQMFRSQSRGATAQLAAVMSDAFGKTPVAGSTQLWTPWIPISHVSLDGTIITLTVGDPAVKEMTIELQPPDANDPLPKYTLTGISYWDRVWVGNKERITSWSLAIHRNVRTFDPGTFVFIPPREARPISLPAKKSG